MFLVVLVLCLSQANRASAAPALKMTNMDTASSFDSVAYRGETVHLSRSYSDFHEYRDDPNNLPENVHQRVAQLVREAPVASQYPTREAVFDALYGLMFPGYGYSAYALDRPVALYSLEVPTTDEQRFLTFVQREGAWVRVDDFLWNLSKGYINHAELKEDRLQYFNQKGQLLRESSSPSTSGSSQR